ncbi:MAG: coniferyl aldehyde dehydrogenase [Enhygromyxa sp.]
MNQRVAAEVEGDAQAKLMQEILQQQRAAYMAELPVPAELRKDRLRRAIDLIVAGKHKFVEALSDDFGHRSPTQSLLTDIMGTLKPLRHALAHVDRWMRPEKRKVEFPLWLFGARARVEYQPKGVVGVISPWNFPIHLSFAPLAQIFAAGNRAMLKPSEYTPATSALMAELARERFDPSELALFTGGVEVGRAFASLAFDHLLFTGGTALAKHILHAAAENLVPTTLELGGKCPVILGESAELGPALERVIMGKMLNAGQICLAPDYLLVPEGKEASVVAILQEAVKRLYPTLATNGDYTAVVNERHRERLRALIEDAEAKGAEVLVLNPGDEDLSSSPKLPLHLICNPTSQMRVMQEEIFGPILPIMTHARIDDAIEFVNAHDRPLALYYFGEDADEQRRVLDRTVSGGVTLNDVLFHVLAEDLPFGGVGASGMGSYHGFDGFKTFSHARAVYTQPKFDLAGLAGLKPPYGDRTQKTLDREIGG